MALVIESTTRADRGLLFCFYAVVISRAKVETF